MNSPNDLHNLVWYNFGKLIIPYGAQFGSFELMTVRCTIALRSFCHRLFDNNYKATIGVDFEVERFDILGVPFHLQM